MTSEKVRVVVGDDHPMFREGVVRALVSSGEIDVVAEAEDGLEALELIRTHQPQVALLDYRMPGMDGAEVAAAVTRDELPTRVLLVSAHDESAIVYKALQEGAAGFLSKESSRSELVSAVLTCAKGKDVITPELAAGLAGEIRRRNEPDVPALSPREREVLTMIAAGSSIPSMAKQMFLAPSTVKTHVQRLYEKLGVSDRGAAVAEAMRRKLLVGVDNPFHWIVDYFVAEPARVSALLRLPLIGLLVVMVSVWEVNRWQPEFYAVVLGSYAIAATVWLVAVLRGPVPRWADYAVTGVDLLVVLVLCLESEGSSEALFPVFFLLPIWVAFQGRPLLTAVVGITAALGYLAVWIFYVVQLDWVLPQVAYVHLGFLLWLTVATTALSYVLNRRSLRVKGLQEMRRQLVSEAMQSDERRNREAAEHLHDGPLQTLLAARLELEEVRERNPDPALDFVYNALQETATGLRSTVTDLHPQVLAQLGLTPAVRELLKQFEARTDTVVEADLEDVGKPESQQLLHRAARELLTNIGKHAGATTARVGLKRKGDRIKMTIADDGTGFDPAIVGQAVAEGHIGLGSLMARFDAMGGAMEIDSHVGGGTRITVTSPPEPASSSSVPAL